MPYGKIVTFHTRLGFVKMNYFCTLHPLCMTTQPNPKHQIFLTDIFDSLLIKYVKIQVENPPKPVLRSSFEQGGLVGA